MNTISDPEKHNTALPFNWLALFSHVWLHLFIITAAVFGVYLHALDAPFYMDDFSSIQENPLIYQWQGVDSLWQYAPLRIVGYLSFAANYALDQFNTASFRMVNIAIHIGMGMSIYWLLNGLLRTKSLQRSVSNAPLLIWLPLLAALLFVLHPLHTQAVTYIVQRLASLAALLYILTMASFVQARLSQVTWQRLFWFAVCGFVFVLALFTKQNTFTLPLALLLLEGIFFTRNHQHFFIIAGGIFVALILFWLLMAFGFDFQPLSLEAMQALTRETEQISRMDYFATQLPVMWTYIGLFVWPTGLHIDYELLPLTGFIHAPVMFALLAHLVILVIAILSFRRLPLIAFAILFYYLAHSIESSVIPIRDVIFEHRTYLPDVGLVILVAWLILAIVPLWLNRYAVILLCGILFFVLGLNTWQRNQVWLNPIALWQDNVKQAPKKSRSWSILGKHLLQAKRPKEGIEALEQSMLLQKETGSQTINTIDVINLIVGLKMLKQYERALNITHQVLKYPMKPLLKSKFYINQANIYFEQKQYKAAEKSLRAGISIYPNSIIARANLASLLGSIGRFAEAEILYREVLQIDPDNQVTQQNIRNLQQLKARQAQRVKAQAQ